MNSFKIFFLVGLTLSLASCTGNTPTNTDTPADTKVTETQEQAPLADNCTAVPAMDDAAIAAWESGTLPNATEGSIGSGNIVLVNYTLRTCTPDGKVLDTSREADARTAGIYMEGRPYEPFQTIIGSHSTVRGFEYGLIGMKKGERKTIAVAAVDGYGIDTSSGSQEERVEKYKIAPEYSLTLDKSLFGDTLTETIAKNLLGDEAKNYKVGQTLTGGQNNDIPGKIVKITDTEVTVAIDNSKNPFHGKEIAPGLSTEVESGVTFTVKALQGTGVVFDVMNKNSPFYNNFATGTSVDLSVGKVTIKSIEENDVIVDILPAKDPKKTSLFFDVEIVDVK